VKEDRTGVIKVKGRGKRFSKRKGGGEKRARKFR